VPRKRMIDPDMWTGETFGFLSDLAQIYFIGLVSNADDYGRFKLNPVVQRAQIRPYKEDSFEAVAGALCEIIATGAVQAYEKDGALYGHLVNWNRFQKVAHPTASKIPAPADGNDVSRTVHESFMNHSRTVHDPFTPRELVELRELRETTQTTPHPHCAGGGENSRTIHESFMNGSRKQEPEPDRKTVLATAAQIERKLEFSLGALQGFHINQLAHFMATLGETKVLGEVLGAAKWLAANGRNWNGVMGVLKNRERTLEEQKRDDAQNQAKNGRSDDNHPDTPGEAEKSASGQGIAPDNPPRVLSPEEVIECGIDDRLDLIYSNAHVQTEDGTMGVNEWVDAHDPWGWKARDVKKGMGQ